MLAGVHLFLIFHAQSLLLMAHCRRLLHPPIPHPLLPLQEGPLELQYVVARGEVVKTPQWVRGGTFERGPGIRPRPPILPQRRG